MNRRIALVLKTKNISPSQFAEELGVQRSGISHILNGRNKPSLEFIQKLIKQYPDISMNWLMFGEGAMMNPYPVREIPGLKTLSANVIKPLAMELFPDMDSIVSSKDDSVDEIEDEFINEEPLTDSIEEDLLTSNHDSKHESHAQKGASHPAKPDRNRLPLETAMFNNKEGREIKRIIIFYSDRSFVEYTPGDE